MQPSETREPDNHATRFDHEYQPVDAATAALAALPGYDDLAYLLKDVEYIGGNYETVLAWTLSEADTQWLYARNRETIFNWMMDRGLSLYDFGYNADVVLEQPEKVRWELVYRWACDTVKTYLGRLK